MASIVSAGTTSATALNMSADTSGVLQLASNNGTVALTVTTSQNVGIANVNPSFPLDVNGASQFSGYSRITAQGGVQRLLIGNQDSLGTNKPNVISCANSTFNIGYGDSWSGNGGTITPLFQMNSSGTNNDFNAVLTGGTTLYPAFFPRSFVSVNQQGSQTILTSGNVSSISDQGTGLTLVNMTTAMPSIEYTVANGISGSGVISGVTLEINRNSSSSYQLRSLSSSTVVAYDMNYVTGIVIR